MIAVDLTAGAELRGVPDPARGASDERRHQRVRIAVLGRYMLADRREYPCRTVDMSPGGVRLACAVRGEVGERVVLYLEYIGRIEGVIARTCADGFAVQLNATPRKRDKLASQLTWLANREMLGLPEGRSHERLVPTQPAVVLRVDGTQEIKARLIDISMSGVAIACPLSLPLGTAVTVGSTPGRLVRYFEGGFGVQFLLPLSPDRFHAGMTL
ncbi:PilZ domain-containing protein [Methylobacterium sp. J-026]|uniref:PilZ domain-containing protein n=1 Tax=Methylobacterium sp. J-026 TaxID=2836624 RepID=UPI001FB8A0C8|nr:PilZ domain-containing protein [Methylobacterium sp. J-026]MCJ2137738.1 PilZ domain-containing protein [Methylobacterium sp. J-026]